MWLTNLRCCLHWRQADGQTKHTQRGPKVCFTAPKAALAHFHKKTVYVCVCLSVRFLWEVKVFGQSPAVVSQHAPDTTYRAGVFILNFFFDRNLQLKTRMKRTSVLKTEHSNNRVCICTCTQKQRSGRVFPDRRTAHKHTNGNVTWGPFSQRQFNKLCNAELEAESLNNFSTVVCFRMNAKKNPKKHMTLQLH